MRGLRDMATLLLVMGVLYVVSWLYLKEHPWSLS